MSVSIMRTLATLPSGAIAEPLDRAGLGKYLQLYCKTVDEKLRNERHALRDELYCDGGVSHMEHVIDNVFNDDKLRQKRKAWVRYARFNNAIKRIVNEMSTVYIEPARRSVENDDERYQAFLKEIRFDEQMLHVHRMLNLHRALLIGASVFVRPDGKREPRFNYATPANVRAVLHPNDNRTVVGWLIKTDYRTRPDAFGVSQVPAWVLWSDAERIFLDADMNMIGDPLPHQFGVNPWVPVTLSPPGPCFWPGCEGEDLVAATIAIWFTNVLMLKETKSATKTPLLSGDTSGMAREQSMDTEGAVEAPDGVSVTTIDNSMDLSLFRDTADHVLDNVGNAYGMPPAVLRHEGVQSAEARELQRVPLRELRKQQQVPLRIAEGAFVRVAAAVMRADAPDWAFDPTGWRIDFGESQTPLSAKETLEVFQSKRAAALDNTVDFIMRGNPDLTREQARTLIELNISEETWRNELMRPLAAISGSLGEDTPSAQNNQDAAAEGLRAPPAAVPPAASDAYPEEAAS